MVQIGGADWWYTLVVHIGGVVWFGQEKKSQHLAESDERWSVVKEECVSLLKVGGDC